MKNKFEDKKNSLVFDHSEVIGSILFLFAVFVGMAIAAYFMH